MSRESYVLLHVAETRKKISWATLFGYVCWDIWTYRCRKVFEPQLTNMVNNGYESFYSACWDGELVENCIFYDKNLMQGTKEISLPNDHVKLEVDGSAKVNAISGCGGAIKDKEGRWIAGFSCKLVFVPPAIAELLGFWNDLRLCWSRGFKNVVLFSDCVEAISFCIRGCDINHPFRDIIEYVRLLLNRE